MVLGCKRQGTQKGDIHREEQTCLGSRLDMRRKEKHKKLLTFLEAGWLKIQTTPLPIYLRRLYDKVV